LGAHFVAQGIRRFAVPEECLVRESTGRKSRPGSQLAGGLPDAEQADRPKREESYRQKGNEQDDHVCRVQLPE
jgi:hypothetical protein